MKQILTPPGKTFRQAPDERAIAEMLCDFQESADATLAALREIRDLLREMKADGERYSLEAKEHSDAFRAALKEARNANTK